ncbi:MAG TPA: L-fucose:H+ symporter permease [Terracidiphilus sp.]|nr:L-fucose:H+ symporter permease [Terracidiphilus sp.]
MPMATPPPTAEQDDSAPLIPHKSLAAFALVTGLFLLWGIANNLNDVLIRQFTKSFDISRLQAGLVQFAFYIGYFTFSVPAALVMRRRGYKFGLVTGLVLYGLGTFLFWPAAAAQSYGLFLVALFVIASGLGFLETGANPLVAQLGEPESAVRRLNFSQAFNPIGSIVGVLIGTVFIFSGVELNAPRIAQLKLAGTYKAYLHNETMRVVPPYMILGAVVLLWAFFIYRTPFPAIAGRSTDANEPQGSYRELLRYPHFLFSVLAQFCYVGAQVGTWSWFIQYVQDYTHLPEKAAGYFLTGTLVGFGVGRFGASHWMRKMQASKLMGLFALANVLLVGVGVLFPGWVGMWAIFLTSFFMSLMYPTIFALGIQDLGPNTKAGASLIVMSIVGGAAIPLLIALLYEFTHSMALAMLVPLACYLVVAWYAFWGCHMKAHAPEAP